MRLKQILVLAVWVAMFAYPYYLIFSPLPSGYFGSTSAGELYATLTRLLGVTIFTLVTQQIFTQSFRPFFNSAFPAYFVKRYHIVVGTLTLLLAMTHPIMHYVANSAAGYPISGSILGTDYQFPLRLYYLLGPLALTILVCTALAGLLRRWKLLQKYWYAIHRFNYVLFVVAFFHSFNVGSDLQAHLGLRFLWIVYACVVGYGFLDKFYLRERRPASTETVSAIPEAIVRERN